MHAYIYICMQGSTYMCKEKCKHGQVSVNVGL